MYHSIHRGIEQIAQVVFGDDVPQPSPSPVPLITVTVQLTSKVHCIGNGNLSLVTRAVWLLNGNEIGEFTIPTTKTIFTSPRSLSGYGTYTCRLTLSSGDTVSDSIVYEDPNPSPSPSPSSSPTPEPSIMSIRRLHTEQIVCRVELSSADIRIFIIYRDGQSLDSRQVNGETTTAIIVMETTPGKYLCIVYTTDGRSIQESLVVPDPTPPPVTVTPPTNLTAKWVDRADGSLGNIQVTWSVPRHSDGLMGYKITWGQPM